MGPARASTPKELAEGRLGDCAGDLIGRMVSALSMSSLLRVTARPSTKLQYRWNFSSYHPELLLTVSEFGKAGTFCKIIVPYVSLSLFPQLGSSGKRNICVVPQIPPPYRLRLICYGLEVSLEGT